MLASVASHGLNGIAGFPVTVEADLSGGLPAYDTVGLPDAAVRESRERVRAAIKNAGFSFPTAHITVSLAPAGMRKEGAVYDLPIAVALLAASGQVPAHAADGLVVLGELALDGTVRAVSGVLPMALSAYGCGIRRIAIPAGNAAEVAYLQDLEVLPVRSLSEFVAHLRGTERILPCPVRAWDAHDVEYGADFSEIRGQQGAKRAAEIAVAGGHNQQQIVTAGFRQDHAGAEHPLHFAGTDAGRGAGDYQNSFGDRRYAGDRRRHAAAVPCAASRRIGACSDRRRRARPAGGNQPCTSGSAVFR